MSFRQMPLFSCLLWMLGALALLSNSTASVQAAVVLQVNFDRVGALNGSTPSFTAGNNWTATPGFSTDGSKVSAAFGLFDDFTSAAYVPMPVAITSGNIYTLSATMYRGLSTDSAAVMMFGFFDANAILECHLHRGRRQRHRRWPAQRQTGR